ncbi:6-bladed beta-propeller [Algoriphagus antarcticus]|uniref:6-bladed beta-propeller protein n=1 Tax=Algoriphagus antarcticus TaxID=238540 RepID=A0A3E0DGI7_9BACT|nr:6-bladed beta-propeller [Algoriphagus antarcticus]REG81692.1 6-bladed beta-propeller protein [Algoriphagus antarcticus]
MNKLNTHLHFFNWNFTIVLIIALLSCSGKKVDDIENDSIRIISIDDPDTFSELDFLEIFELIDVKELENDLEFFLAEASKLVISESGYIVLDNDLDALLRFNVNGEVENKVCTLGDGPTEMQAISDFAYDQKKDEIYVIGPGNMQVKVYKPDGTFVRNFKIGSQADHIALLGDQPVLTLTYFNPYNKYLSVLEHNGDTLKTVFPFPKETFPIGLHHISGNLTNSNSGGILVNEPASSTVYGMDSKMNLKPKYKFVAIDDLWPEEDRHELNAYFEKLATGDLTFLSKYYEESESYFFFNLNAKKKGGRLYVVDPRIGYYDIKAGKSYLAKSEKFLMEMKGPLAVDGDSFYVYISKMELSELLESDDKWKAIMADFPEIEIMEKADYDTPVLLKFGVK